MLDNENPATRRLPEALPIDLHFGFGSFSQFTWLGWVWFVFTKSIGLGSVRSDNSTCFKAAGPSVIHMGTHDRAATPPSRHTNARDSPETVEEKRAEQIHARV